VIVHKLVYSLAVLGKQFPAFILAVPVSQLARKFNEGWITAQLIHVFVIVHKLVYSLAVFGKQFPAFIFAVPVSQLARKFNEGWITAQLIHVYDIHVWTRPIAATWILMLDAGSDRLRVRNYTVYGLFCICDLQMFKTSQK